MTVGQLVRLAIVARGTGGLRRRSRRPRGGRGGPAAGSWASSPPSGPSSADGAPSSASDDAGRLARLRLRPPREPRRRRRLAAEPPSDPAGDEPSAAPVATGGRVGIGRGARWLAGDRDVGGGLSSRLAAGARTGSGSVRSVGAVSWSDIGVVPSHDARLSACGADVAPAGASRGSRRAPSCDIHWWSAAPAPPRDRRSRTARSSADAQAAGWVASSASSSAPASVAPVTVRSSRRAGGRR